MRAVEPAIDVTDMLTRVARKGMIMISYAQHFISARRVDPLGSARIDVRSPHDGELVGATPAASKADVDLAVAAARPYDEFVAVLVEMVARLKGGDPSDPETFIGPMVAERQGQWARTTLTWA
jgi:acyl-CoA reductase-like NAD-dependent aldehyde dehydrogenase